MRVGTLPWIRGVTTINGFEGMDTTIDVEAIAQAPYVLGGDLSIGRVALSTSPERATPREIRYDFSCGELRASLDFEGDEARAEITWVAFCSRTRPSLVLQEAYVVPDRDCDLGLSVTVDTGDIPRSWGNREVDPPPVLAIPIDWILRW